MCRSIADAAVLDLDQRFERPARQCRSGRLDSVSEPTSRTQRNRSKRVCLVLETRAPQRLEVRSMAARVLVLTDYGRRIAARRPGRQLRTVPFGTGGSARPSLPGSRAAAELKRPVTCRG